MFECSGESRWFRSQKIPIHTLYCTETPQPSTSRIPIANLPPIPNVVDQGKVPSTRTHNPDPYATSASSSESDPEDILEKSETPLPNMRTTAFWDESTESDSSCAKENIITSGTPDTHRYNGLTSIQ